MTRVGLRSALLRAAALSCITIDVVKLSFVSIDVFDWSIAANGFRERMSIQMVLEWAAPWLGSLLLSVPVLLLAPRIAAAPRALPADQPLRAEDVLRCLSILAGLFALDQAAMRLPTLVMRLSSPDPESFGPSLVLFQFPSDTGLWVRTGLWMALGIALLLGPARIGGRMSRAGAWIRGTFTLPRSRDAAGA